MKTAIIYSRISTTFQDAESQNKGLIEFPNRNNYQLLTESFTETISGITWRFRCLWTPNSGLLAEEVEHNPYPVPEQDSFTPSDDDSADSKYIIRGKRI